MTFISVGSISEPESGTRKPPLLTPNFVPERLLALARANGL
jgi:hypothetical protein